MQQWKLSGQGSGLIRKRRPLEPSGWYQLLFCCAEPAFCSASERGKEMSLKSHPYLSLTNNRSTVLFVLLWAVWGERQSHMDHCSSHGALPVLECLIHTCWLNEWNNRLQSMLTECCITKINICFCGNLKTWAMPPQWQTTYFGREQTSTYGWG